MAGSSEPAFLFFNRKKEPLLHRLFIYFATAPLSNLLTILTLSGLLMAISQTYTFDFSLLTVKRAGAAGISRLTT